MCTCVVCSMCIYVYVCYVVCACVLCGMYVCAHVHVCISVCTCVCMCICKVIHSKHTRLPESMLAWLPLRVLGGAHVCHSRRGEGRGAC